VKYRIVLNAKENCADLLYTGINHDENWEGDSTKIRTDERIERMIRESGRRIKEMTPDMIFKEASQLRRKYNFTIDHGAFFLSTTEIGSSVYNRRSYDNSKESSYQSFEEVKKFVGKLKDDKEAIEVEMDSFSDFCFVLTKKEFVQSYKAHAQQISFIDSVHKIFDMKYPLWLYGHLDDDLHGVPVFLILSSHHNSKYLTKALEGIKLYLLDRDIELSKRTILDKDPVELKSLENLGIDRLLCKVCFDLKETFKFNSYQCLSQTPSLTCLRHAKGNLQHMLKKVS